LPENIHDKGYKRILSTKKVFLSMLKSFIHEPWAQDINEKDLELIDKEFILKDFTEKEADIIYRLNYKDSEIIFYCLLELQSGVDFTMPFRLLVYMVEMLRRIFMEKPQDIRESVSYKLPAVIPIVLYNGADKWTAKTSFKEYLSGYELYGNHIIDFNYILLDINRYDAKSLAEMGNLISAVFMLDKKQSDAEFIKNLPRALKMGLTLDERISFKNWIIDVLCKKAGNNRDFISEALESLKSERGVDDMTYAIEKIWDEVEARGIEQGIEQTVLRMLKKNRSIDEIYEYTDLPKDKILRLKEELEIAAR